MSDQSGVWVQQTTDGKGVFSRASEDLGCGEVRVGYATVEPHSEWAEGVLADMQAFAQVSVVWSEIPYESFFVAIFMLLPDAVDVMWLDGDPLPMTEAGMRVALSNDRKLWELAEKNPQVWGRVLLERVLRGIQDEDLKAMFRSQYLAGMAAAAEVGEPN